MNIVEALKLSNSVINQKLRRTIDILNNKDTRHINLTTEEMFSNDWVPIIEKKTVKKKFYQAIIHNEINNIYSIPVTVFETPEQAEKYASTCSSTVKLIRFLVENPIEVEVEELK